MDAAEMPLVAALAAAAARDHAPFYAPGHKRGVGVSDGFKGLLGEAVFRADLPELPELDDLFTPAGPILAAQELAAATFGAQRTWFLANGSTCGLQAAILATCAPGDRVIVPRNAHRSVTAGVILAGAVPEYVLPEYDPQWDLAGAVSAAAVGAALRRHPEAKAVVVVSPTYQGICADVGAIATQTQAHNLPLIVDAAHGPHLGFHPELPPRPLAQGADVVVQSTHKVLSALTQAAMLHVGSDRVDPQRLSRALALTQSTSPSYLLLASLDAARHQLATQGKALMARTLALAERLRTQLPPALPVLSPADLPPEHCLDPTRITVDVSAAGWSGFAADEYLHARGVTAELPTLRHLTFILSLGNTAADVDRLAAALTDLLRHPPERPYRPLQSNPAELPPRPLTPRQAFFAPATAVPAAAALGHPSAELICPYPPGIPVLLPGETITAAALEHLHSVRRHGGRITGCSDPTLTTLRILTP